MTALATTRRNPDLERKYTVLLDAGKPGKVAVTAVMRKLVVLTNTGSVRKNVQALAFSGKPRLTTPGMCLYMSP